MARVSSAAYPPAVCVPAEAIHVTLMPPCTSMHSSTWTGLNAAQGEHGIPTLPAPTPLATCTIVPIPSDAVCIEICLSPPTTHLLEWTVYDASEAIRGAFVLPGRPYCVSTDGGHLPADGIALVSRAPAPVLVWTQATVSYKKAFNWLEIPAAPPPEFTEKMLSGIHVPFTMHPAHEWAAVDSSRLCAVVLTPPTAVVIDTPRATSSPIHICGGIAPDCPNPSPLTTFLTLLSNVKTWKLSSVLLDEAQSSLNEDHSPDAIIITGNHVRHSNSNESWVTFDASIFKKPICIPFGTNWEFLNSMLTRALNPNPAPPIRIVSSHAAVTRLKTLGSMTFNCRALQSRVLTLAAPVAKPVLTPICITALNAPSMDATFAWMYDYESFTGDYVLTLPNSIHAITAMKVSDMPPICISTTPASSTVGTSQWVCWHAARPLANFSLQLSSGRDQVVDTLAPASTMAPVTVNIAPLLLKGLRHWFHDVSLIPVVNLSLTAVTTGASARAVYTDTIGIALSSNPCTSNLTAWWNFTLQRPKRGIVSWPSYTAPVSERDNYLSPLITVAATHLRVQMLLPKWLGEKNDYISLSTLTIQPHKSVTMAVPAEADPVASIHVRGIPFTVTAARVDWHHTTVSVFMRPGETLIIPPVAATAATNHASTAAVCILVGRVPNQNNLSTQKWYSVHVNQSRLVLPPKTDSVPGGSSRQVSDLQAVSLMGFAAHSRPSMSVPVAWYNTALGAVASGLLIPPPVAALAPVTGADPTAASVVVIQVTAPSCLHIREWVPPHVIDAHLVWPSMTSPARGARSRRVRPLQPVTVTGIVVTGRTAPSIATLSSWPDQDFSAMLRLQIRIPSGSRRAPVFVRDTTTIQVFANPSPVISRHLPFLAVGRREFPTLLPLTATVLTHKRRVAPTTPPVVVIRAHATPAVGALTTWLAQRFPLIMMANPPCFLRPLGLPPVIGRGDAGRTNDRIGIVRSSLNVLQHVLPVVVVWHRELTLPPVPAPRRPPGRLSLPKGTIVVATSSRPAPQPTVLLTWLTKPFPQSMTIPPLPALVPPIISPDHIDRVMEKRGQTTMPSTGASFSSRRPAAGT
jgi:hypothetical protein